MGILTKTIVPVCLLSLASIIGCADQGVEKTNKNVNTFDHNSAALLQQQFMTPANENKPLTWYHVMNANMSKAGITKDFEAMAEAGIGGVLYFNLGRNIPKGKVLFNTPNHIDMIGHMAIEAKRLGLSFGIHNADGWSSSGGPWITPAHGMKQVTWNETVVVSNGGDVKVQLAQPMTMLDYYQDIAVLAYPSLPTELVDAELNPIITASDPNFDTSVVSNIEVMKKSSIKSKNNQPVWLQFAYNKPVTIRFASMDISFGKKIKYELQYSNDGKNFKKHVDLKVNRPGRVRWALDGAFEGVTAKYFRIVANETLNIFEASLSSTPRMGNFLGRTLATRTDYEHLPKIGNPDQAHIIDTKKIINLTDKLSADGQLTTQLPIGNWTIMRFGYTAKGTTNIPPTAEGLGLEVDKFSRAAFKTHYDAYVTNVINKVKDVAPGVMQFLEIDSYEVGGQNWTQGYEQAFKQQHQYDLVPFLPLFAGKFVDSAETTEAVSWDIRELSNKLITENYYQYFTELAHADGMKTYNEPYGIGPFNDLDVGGKVDIPMGEFWLKRNIYMLASATSAGHIYNKNIISAEAFTATKDHNWRFNPADAKYDGDFSWALGINEFVFHRFVHQANTHVVPGMTMEYWGAHVDATQPWFETAGKAWFNYLSRGQYMLRQGQPVSDLLWYVGDSAPTECPDRLRIKKKLPTYINYDCLNRDVLQNKLFYKNGRYQLEHGVKYKALKLTNHDTLYLDSVKKIYQFAQQGGVIIGKPIKQLAGRDVTKAQQQEFRKMVDYIWAQPTTYLTVETSADWHKLYEKQQLNFDLEIKNIEPLFYTHRKTASQDIYFVYNNNKERRLFDATFEVTGKIPELWDANTGKIKKLATFKTGKNTTDVAFRLDPEESAFIVFQRSSNDVKVVDPQVVRDRDIEVVYDENNDLQLSAQTNQTLDVTIDGDKQETRVKNIPTPQALNGSWQVSFMKQYGLEKTVTFNQLVNFKDHSDPEIRAYSGISRYQKDFALSSELLASGQRIILDLGQLSNSAKVFINGVDAGVTWVAPFTLDVTNYLHVGENSIRIDVASSWINRLITDEAYPDYSQFWREDGKPVNVMPDWYTENKPLPHSGEKGKRMTFTTYKFVSKDDPLEDSGLLGPVTLQAIKQIKL